MLITIDISKKAYEDFKKRAAPDITTQVEVHNAFDDALCWEYLSGDQLKLTEPYPESHTLTGKACYFLGKEKWPVTGYYTELTPMDGYSYVNWYLKEANKMKVEIYE